MELTVLGLSFQSWFVLDWFRTEQPKQWQQNSIKQNVWLSEANKMIKIESVSIDLMIPGQGHVSMNNVIFIEIELMSADSRHNSIQSTDNVTTFHNNLMIFPNSIITNQTFKLFSFFFFMNISNLEFNFTLLDWTNSFRNIFFYFHSFSLLFKVQLTRFIFLFAHCGQQSSEKKFVVTQRINVCADNYRNK